VADRLPEFLSGLDLEAGTLIASRRLVAAALGATGGLSPASWGRPLKRGALADARTGVALALQLAAQRMGVARVARRGLFGFGGRTVWELPPALVPFAVGLYLLQAGPLLNADDDDDGGSAAAADAWRLRVHQFLYAAPGVGGALAAPSLYVQQQQRGEAAAAAAAALDVGSGSGSGSGAGGFDQVPPVTLAVGPQSLAVLDCGTEILVFAGAALQGSGGASSAAAAAAAAAGGRASNGVTFDSGGAAAGAATPTSSAQPGTSHPSPASPQPPNDLPTAVAPAVQYAHQLARGRLPVPSIHVLQDARGAAGFMYRLLPLHLDVLPLQMALQPGLRDLSPHAHADLVEWHRGWGAAGAVQRGGAFGHFCGEASVSLPVEGGLMEAEAEEGGE